MVSTPIGNLEDISRRAVDTLRSVDCILAEDTRRTQKLLTRSQLHTPLISCHKFNEASRVQMVVDKIKAGSAVALVTSAGTPGVSDPGSRLISACRKEGLYITLIPGPSAVTAAAALCGFGADKFFFEGFLPRKPGARKRRLMELRHLTCAVVIFESPYRYARLLEEMQEIFGEREVFMARELTKLNEECLWGTAETLREILNRRGLTVSGRSIKGEITLVIAPAPKSSLKTKNPYSGKQSAQPF